MGPEIVSALQPSPRLSGFILLFAICAYATHLAIIRQASRSTAEHAEQISSTSFSDSAKKRDRLYRCERVWGYRQIGKFTNTRILRSIN